MSNANTATIAANLARRGSSVLQSCQAPIASVCTVIDYTTPNDLPALQSTVAVATTPATTLIGPSPNFENGDTTVVGVSMTPTLFVQPFGLSGPDMQVGPALDWLAAINARKFAEALNDQIWTLLTTANFGAAIVNVDSANFNASDFETLFSGIPTVDKSIVLDTPYFAKVKPATWLPPRFSAVYEHSRWGTAGAKVRGFCGDKRAIILRSGPPMLYRDAPNILAREVLEIQPLGLLGEVTIWFNPSTRSIRAAYATYLGAAVGDASALKLLTLL